MTPKRPSARALPIPRGMTVAEFNAALRRARQRARLQNHRARPAVHAARMECQRRYRAKIAAEVPR